MKRAANYSELGIIGAGRGTTMTICNRCGSIVIDNDDGKRRHDWFHDKVETALSQAQGFTPEGDPYGWNK